MESKSGGSDLVESLLRTAHFAAWQAGQIIRQTIDNPPNVRDKGPRDRVTDSDFAAQAAVLGAIRSAFPDHHILSEEDTANHRQDGGRWHVPDGVVWMVDPLDGTTNFAASLPFACVSVGVAVDGEPVAGAIYDPLRQEMFSAGRGLGASLNGQTLAPIKSMRLDDALVCLDWSHAAPRRNLALKGVAALLGRCRTVRSLGSAALSLAYVALGRLGLYFNFGLQPWDQAAGAILLTEAGAGLANPEGGAWRLGDPALLAGHPALIAEALPIIQEAIRAAD